MELTTSQKLAFISEMLSSESGINEFIRVLLDSFSKQERAFLWKSMRGNSTMVSIPVGGRAMDVALSYGFPECVREIFSL